MSFREPVESRHVLAALQVMTTLSTLSVAAEIRHSIRERRAGIDPSAQEPAEVAHDYLRDTIPALREMLTRLRVMSAVSETTSDHALSSLVRRFDELMIIRRLGRLTHTCHQRMLTLYPAVPEELIEEARTLTGMLSSRLESDDDHQADSDDYIFRGMAFVNALEVALDCDT